MRSQIYKMINKEIEYASKGKPSSIILKMNSLSDPLLIKKLFSASKKGVRVQLIIRGICCVPKDIGSTLYHPIPRSIVDQYLEQRAESLQKPVEATKGKFFSLTFVKKDGTIRTINAKDRFTGLIKGTGSPATDALRQGGYMFAVDRNRNSYFCFKPEKVLLFKCGKIDKQFSSVVA